MRRFISTRTLLLGSANAGPGPVLGFICRPLLDAIPLFLPTTTKCIYTMGDSLLIRSCVNYFFSFICQISSAGYWCMMIFLNHLVYDD
jgi:hypothetical protein